MPPKGATTNWGDIAVWERLVACIVASGVKLDLALVARYYGVTYDTVANRFRKIKKMADEVKEEAQREGRLDMDNASPVKSKSTPRKPKAARDPLESVASGRVNKSTPTRGKKKVKQDEVDGDGDGNDGEEQAAEAGGQGAFEEAMESGGFM